MNNDAFIDGQNLYSGVRQLGWDLDTGKFRVYLGRNYGVTRAFYYELAVLVSGDGDFYSLVRHRRTQQKPRAVLSPNRRYCSALLKQQAGGRLWFIEDVRRRLQR